MISSELLKEAIADAKAVRMLVLSYNDGQVTGTCGYDVTGSIVRLSGSCHNCEKRLAPTEIEKHKKICPVPLTGSFNWNLSASIYRLKKI